MQWYDSLIELCDGPTLFMYIVDKIKQYGCYSDGCIVYPMCQLKG